ncbi:hypothetical protein [Mesorhizobium sp. M0965]|uniref:hypothetical protein n=1 Tax=Mesorhizobium sp. M0965 TaxID=2957036 RepID=UPI0033379B1E
MTLLDTMRQSVDSTIDSLASAEFRPDPIAGTLFSRVVSVLSSAYKRHGSIIEKAILERLRENPRYDVWGVEGFGIQNQASITVAAALNNPTSLYSTHLPYIGDHLGESRLQLDAVVFDKQTNIVSSYEIKRGNGQFDAGKQRSMKREALLSKVLLRDHAIQRGFNAQDSRAHIVFYYGIRSIAAPLGLIGTELDDHFGMAIWDEVEIVNSYFRSRLFEIISQ